MQSCIPIEELMLCCVFFHICNLIFVIRIIIILFYLAYTHLPKFKTSVILMAIQLLKFRAEVVGY